MHLKKISREQKNHRQVDNCDDKGKIETSSKIGKIHCQFLVVQEKSLPSSPFCASSFLCCSTAPSYRLQETVVVHKVARQLEIGAMVLHGGLHLGGVAVGGLHDIP